MSSRRRRHRIVHQLSAPPFEYQALCGVKAGVKAEVVEAAKFRAALDRSFVGSPLPLDAVVRCVNCSRIARST